MHSSTHQNGPKPEFTTWVFVCCLSYLVLAPSISTAANIYVPEDYQTIQSAINAAGDRDTVYVGPGIYRENIITGGNRISVISTDGPESTIIEPASGITAVIGPSAIFSGFTIKNVSNTQESAVKVLGIIGSRITGNIFEPSASHTGDIGGAIDVVSRSSYNYIERNIFQNMPCTNSSANAVIRMLGPSSAHIRNNIIADNACSALYLTADDIQAWTSSNTIVRNLRGILTNGDSFRDSSFNNNIIFDNDIGLELVNYNGESTYRWSYNIVFNNGDINDRNYVGISDLNGQRSNLATDPMFVDAPGNDFHIRQGSPAIDAGYHTFAPFEDLDGDRRPVDGNGDGHAVYDIGADEFFKGFNIAIDGGPQQECNSYGGTYISINAIPFPESVSITSILWYLDGKLFSDSPETTVNIPLGSHVIYAEVITSEGETFTGSESIEIRDTTPPEIIAAFIDRRTGNLVSYVDTNSAKRLNTSIKVTDTCDEVPAHQARIGVPAYDGDPLKVKAGKNKALLEASELELYVTAQDASGNLSESRALLELVE